MHLSSEAGPLSSRCDASRITCQCPLPSHVLKGLRPKEDGDPEASTGRQAVRRGQVQHAYDGSQISQFVTVTSPRVV